MRHVEVYAESYHFPYVHGRSIIGQSTVADTGIHDALGPHGRVCFPYAWATEAESTEPVDVVTLIYWIFPNLVLAFTPVGVEWLDILPAGRPTRCSVCHGWLAKEAPATDEDRAGYDALFDVVHAALVVEDFAMLPQCGEAIRHGQHGHMLIGRNEIGVQHVVRTFAAALGLDLGAARQLTPTSPNG